MLYGTVGRLLGPLTQATVWKTSRGRSHTHNLRACTDFPAPLEASSDALRALKPHNTTPCPRHLLPRAWHMTIGQSCSSEGLEKPLQTMFGRRRRSSVKRVQRASWTKATPRLGRPVPASMNTQGLRRPTSARAPMKGLRPRLARWTSSLAHDAVKSQRHDTPCCELRTAPTKPYTRHLALHARCNIFVRGRRIGSTPWRALCTDRCTGER